MEGTKVRKLRNLRVERNFEGGRLERQLLASAYERAVPTVAASAGMVRDQRAAGQQGSDLEIRIGKGA